MNKSKMSQDSGVSMWRVRTILTTFTRCTVRFYTVDVVKFFILMNKSKMSQDSVKDRDYEKLQELLDDDTWKEVSDSLKKLIDNYLQKSGPHAQAVAELTELKEAIEKSYNDSRKARIAGTTATVIAIIITVAAFGLGFITLGASLGLTIIAAVLAAAGGVTIRGAEIGYFVVSRNKQKEAEKVHHKLNEMMQEIKEHSEKYIKSLSKLERYATQGEYECHICTEFYSRCILRSELINGVEDIGNCIIVITNFVRAGLQASAQSVYFGLGTFGRALSIGSLAFAILFLPINTAILVKSAYDVHKYKNGNGKSNSAAAKNIGSVLEKMKKNEVNLIKFRDQLPGTGAGAKTD